MTEDHSTNSLFLAVGTDQASRMLRMGIHGPSRPVDALLERLSEVDGDKWLQNVLSYESMTVVASLPSVGVDHAITVEALTTIKEASKAAARRAGSPDASLRAMVAYFLAIAGALALFRTNISSRSVDELEPILIDLASVAPPDWSSVLERAWSGQKLTSSSTPQGDGRFGFSLSVAYSETLGADQIIIGQPNYDKIGIGIPAMADVGRAYIFGPNGAGWSIRRAFRGSALREKLGMAVATSGDVMLIGADGAADGLVTSAQLLIRGISDWSDADSDGVGDLCDNCPFAANGPTLRTCTAGAVAPCGVDEDCDTFLGALDGTCSVPLGICVTGLVTLCDGSSGDLDTECDSALDAGDGTCGAESGESITCARRHRGIHDGV